MYLSFQNKSFWESLHLKSGLEDWDMAEELKLTVTAKEFPQGPGSQPQLWMWVKPSLVCPIARSPGTELAGSNSLVASVADATDTSSPRASWDYSDLDCSEEYALSSSSKAGKLTEDEDASCVDVPVPQEMAETPRLEGMLMPQKSAVLRAQSRKLKRPWRRSIKTEGGWLRSPLNYCILDTLALCNSASGSLTLKQIYQSIRRHFPFFQMVPRGWKSTIRLNLCFNSCFERTTGFACSKRNHKSSLWKLTPEQRRKSQEEAQILPREFLDVVLHCMSKLDTFRRAGALRNTQQLSLSEIPAVGGTQVGIRASTQPPACGTLALRHDLSHLEVPVETPTSRARTPDQPGNFL